MEQLDSLDRYQSDVMERWASPNDFARVDLVCADLLKKGFTVEAIKYMERVQSLTGAIVTRLKAKLKADRAENEADHKAAEEQASLLAGEEGSKVGAPGAGGPTGASGGGSGLLRKAMAGARVKGADGKGSTISKVFTPKLVAKIKAVAAVSSMAKSMSERHEHQKRYHDHPREDATRLREARKQNDELQKKLARLDRQVRDHQMELEEKERSLDATRKRVNQRGTELMSATARVELLEKKNQNLEDRVGGLKMMAEKYQEDAKKARTWATKLHSKLSKEQEASKDQGSVELLEEEVKEVRGEMRKQTTLLKVKDRLLAESREHHQKGLEKVKAELEDLRQKLEHSEKRAKELGGDSSAPGGAKTLKKKKKSPYEA